jgi:hypothetical protein
MQHGLVRALVCAAFAAVATVNAAPLDRPALSLQIGRLIATSDAVWRGGDLSGNVAIDFPVSAAFAAVVALGTSRGIRGGDYSHESVELTNTYLVAAIRLTSTPQGASHSRAFVLVGYGLLQATARHEVSNYTPPFSQAFRNSGTGGTAVFGVGLIVPIPRSRLAVVGEVSGLLPQTTVPGGGSHTAPSQFLATAGVRVALGR